MWHSQCHRSKGNGHQSETGSFLSIRLEKFKTAVTTGLVGMQGNGPFYNVAGAVWFLKPLGNSLGNIVTVRMHKYFNLIWGCSL